VDAYVLLLLFRFLSHEDPGVVLHHESYAAFNTVHNASFYDAMLDRLASYGAATTLITAMDYETQRIFDAVKRHRIMSSDKFLWVGPNDWVGYNVSNVPVGSLGVTIYSLNSSESMASKFMALWQSLDPSEYPDADGDRSTLSSYSAFAVDALYAVARAFQRVIDGNFEGSGYAKRKEAYQELIDGVQFDGVSGHVSLDASGDRELSRYAIRNYRGGGGWEIIGYTASNGISEHVLDLDDSKLIWPDGGSGAAHGAKYSVQYIPECPAGYEPKDKSGTYTCEPCDVGYYKPYVGPEACSACPEGADCEGVGISVPCILPGYWRPQPPAGEEGDFDTWSVFKCDVRRRCLGGCDLSATCAENVIQSSPVCGVCLDGYYSDRSGCSKCPASQSSLLAAEYALIVLLILFVFTAILGLYVFSIQSATRTSIITGGSFAARSQNSISEKSSFDRSSRTSITQKIVFAIQFFRNLKASGLFVTVKLTVSFFQVIIGGLSHSDIEWKFSLASSIFAVDLNPMNYVPAISQCASKGSLDKPFVHILIILFLPAMFIALLIFAYHIVLYLIRRNAPTILSSSAKIVNKTMFDITLKGLVWFFLFSFPLLASG
jgi:hypothetical protein